MSNQETQENLAYPFIRHYEDRLTRVEGQVSDLRVTVVKIEKDMTYNNELTQQIKADTAEMVNISKGMRLLGRVLTGVVLLGAAYGALEALRKFVA